MPEFTLEMNEEIKLAFENYSLSEDDSEFYNYTSFDELQEGDLILFPFNLRSGIYKIKKGILGPRDRSDNKVYSMAYRNCSSSYLIPDSRNSGIWVMKIDPKYVDWEFWKDVESMLSFNFFDLSLSVDKVHGYSNWYLFNGWRKEFPLEIFKSKEVRKILC